jgi:hypothetical protein
MTAPSRRSTAGAHPTRVIASRSGIERANLDGGDGGPHDPVMALVFRTSGMQHFLILVTALLLAGCATEPPSPWSASLPAGMPESVEVMFRTDPITGKSDGPFDLTSGRRVETHIGDDGIMRVVIDPATRLPRLQPGKATEPLARP